jgi:uncharacterized protein (DUF2336 family)
LCHVQEWGLAITDHWEKSLAQTSQALEELQTVFAAKDSASQEVTLDKITDLFLAGSARFSESHIAVFDQVIGLLSAAIEIRARARLAEKLADSPNAPPGVVRALSCDKIVVARPVLSRSPRLTDADLVAAARAGGRDHMLAISERRNLSEPVTDVLVTEGDRVVLNSVASNPTAKGYDVLIAKSRVDELLQSALGRRNDIPQRHMAILFDLAKKAARERLMSEPGTAARRAVSQAVNASARDIAAETAARSDAYRQAVHDVSSLVQTNELGEASIVEFARTGQSDHAVIGLSYLSKMPTSMVERAVMGPETDGLLILCKSINLGWATVRGLYVMRPANKPSGRQLDELSAAYGKLTPATAQRVLRFLHAKESAANAAAGLK